LIVPTVQGLSGVPIPSRLWAAIGLALGGVLVFTQDPSQSDCASLQGDLLCVLAAIFYATYDLRLFKWGKLVATNELIGTKMVTQSVLSLGLLLLFGREGTLDFFSKASNLDLELVGVVALWSGLAVNCLAPYLQVSGQQAVGPLRAQIIYASQPLWAAIMGFYLLGERIGTGGLLGGSAFLGAILLAATAELPDPKCPADECEV
jgi:drug/metabolite transporter (DMT)-like permease